jgi:MFS family permease
MSHVAYTAMGRYFDAQRGKATALVSMGFAFGEALLPMAAVAAIAAVGWRYSYMGVAVLVLVLVLPLSLWLLRGHHERHQNYERDLKQREGAGSAAATASRANVVSWRRRDVLKDYRFYLLVPGVSATSLVGTAMFFHHLNLADEKGWSHTFMTSSYLLYSFMVIVTAVICG